jgi:transposase-like protein
VIPIPAARPGHGSKFGRKKEEAIAALLAHRNVEEAARATGLSPQTLYKWLKIPAFEARYSEGRQAIFKQSLARLQHASAAAVTILLKVLHDPGASQTARLKGCRSHPQPNPGYGRNGGSRGAPAGFEQ